DRGEPLLAIGSRTERAHPVEVDHHAEPRQEAALGEPRDHALMADHAGDRRMLEPAGDLVDAAEAGHRTDRQAVIDRDDQAESRAGIAEPPEPVGLTRHDYSFTTR